MKSHFWGQKQKTQIFSLFFDFSTREHLKGGDLKTWKKSLISKNETILTKLKSFSTSSYLRALVGLDLSQFLHQKVKCRLEEGRERGTRVSWQLKLEASWSFDEHQKDFHREKFQTPMKM